MLIYLDMCCLKRPFDDQSQPRIRLETEAVLSLLAMEGSKVQFVRSRALFLENDLNPVRERALRVEEWLRASAIWEATDPSSLQKRVGELMKMGFKSFDALHISSAEQAQAAIFATTDDKVLAAAKRLSSEVRTKICSVVQCAAEVAI